jgi:hypothetical protein
LTKEEKYSKILRVRIDPDLLGNVRREADKLEIDISTYIRWCIQTGLYLEDLNLFIRSRSDENHLEEIPNSLGHR